MKTALATLIALAISLGEAPAQQNNGPRGQTGSAATGSSEMWAFQPQRDTFSADALLDLRALNEPIAGQSGFIKLSPDKNGFVRGDGAPIRFWSVNFDADKNAPPAALAHAARFLAKRGVNMVRVNGFLQSHDKNPALTDPDRKWIDHIWRLVAAMKKEGIYTTISPYWCNNLTNIPRSWGIEGWPEHQAPNGLLFFNPRLQEGYRAWLKALLGSRNPYTGISLARDSSVAVIQLQNEDSLLFWSQQSIKGKQLELLEKQFGDWAKQKYGTIEAALKEWNGAGKPKDDPQRGVLAIQIIWELTQQRSGGVKKRLDDQLQFLAETMHRFNKQTAGYLREQLGCQQLINAGNWKTADSLRLFDAERWSYTANEVMANNRFYSPVHLGREAGWNINKGDRFQNLSILFNPRSFPGAMKLVEGYPMMITETHWVPPLGYQSEAPFLSAAYQSLTGLDVLCWLRADEKEWANHQSVGDYRFKWTIATPMMLGQFPAAALLFRRGDVSIGQPAVVEHRSLEQIWGHEPALIADEPDFDPNRDRGDIAPRVQGSVDPLAFFVGPVEAVYGSDPAKTTVVDLNRYIDHKNKVVRSITGELVWDYGRGLCTVDAPRPEAATGLLAKAGPIKLRDVTIDSKNSYATIVVISLDGQPLATTARALVQVGTRARPTGWSDHTVTFKVDNGKQTVSGRQVDDFGRMPWIIDATRAKITARNSKLTLAALLDINGNPTNGVPVRAIENAVEVDLPPNAMYVVLSGK